MNKAFTKILFNQALKVKEVLLHFNDLDLAPKHLLMVLLAETGQCQRTIPWGTLVILGNPVILVTPIILGTLVILVIKAIQAIHS